ncbi:MAG: tryptophan--tRNA ligase [Verrucomicrobiota bacterium]
MRVLSGIQPSGAPHLGNYFGMMQPAIALQEQGDECYYFIADYHAQTTVQDADLLRSNIQRAAIDFLACGLDGEKSVFFRQSAVPEVHELAWYLSTLCPMGLLERCHSYKDKVAKGIKPSHGLFAYPVLMAADILLYHSQKVPVGKDQKQHVEVARDLALKFNDRFGDVLTVPEPVIRDDTATLPGLDGQKMSKSYNNTLEIFLPEKKFRKKIMSIKTDSTPVEDPKPTEGSLLLSLADATGMAEGAAEIKARMGAGGCGYGDLKQMLFEMLWDYFAPMRERREALESDPSMVEKVLTSGEERARATANETLTTVRQAVGVR